MEVARECIGMEGEAGEAGVRIGVECLRRYEEGVEWVVEWVEEMGGAVEKKVPGAMQTYM